MYGFYLSRGTWRIWVGLCKLKRRGCVMCVSSFVQGYAGRKQANTTTRAIELACVSLSEQAVPHVALCFAVLFGESPATSAASVKTSGGTGEKRSAVLLRSRILKSMEVCFGVWVFYRLAKVCSF